MKQQGRILIVDDEAAARRALHGDLLTADFDVTDADNPEDAIALCRVMEFDIVLLITSPWKRGSYTCQALRSEIPQAAILVLTESGDPDGVAEMLDAGADQCLPRGMYRPELVARLRATLRRTRSSSNSGDEAIVIGDVRLDPAQRQVYRAGVPVRLTPKEFTLLHYLMSNAGRPIAHESLLRAVWGADHIGRVEYLRIFMRQLRTKLNDHIHPQYLLTESCIGYRFAEPSRAPSIDHQPSRAAAA